MPMAPNAQHAAMQQALISANKRPRHCLRYLQAQVAGARDGGVKGG